MWVYTPPTSYQLTGINTKFGVGASDDPTTEGRVVTLEVYDEHPFHGGGTLLRSVNFSVAEMAFSGGSFAALSLQSGEDYYIGFRNVTNLGVNWTGDAGATFLAQFWAGNPSYPGQYRGSTCTQCDPPILQFLGYD
jgi:hypothetical protein